MHSELQTISDCFASESVAPLRFQEFPATAAESIRYFYTHTTKISDTLKTSSALDLFSSAPNLFPSHVKTGVSYHLSHVSRYRRVRKDEHSRFFKRE